MSIYYRICPHDNHTCADRQCLSPMHDVCVFAAAKPMPATGPLPIKTADQVKPDEPNYGDYC